jgi:predicted ester cyclase
MRNLDTEALNKQLVRDAFQAIDEQQFDRLREFLQEDMTCNMVGVPEPMGRDATVEFIANAYAIFPDFRHELHEVLAEGNKVMVRLTNHTTHQNEFEGLAPTGNRIRYASAHMVTIERGAIAEWWLLEDNFGFLTQLGMQMTPAEPEA